MEANKEVGLRFGFLEVRCFKAELVSAGADVFLDVCRCSAVERHFVGVLLL